MCLVEVVIGFICAWCGVVSWCSVGRRARNRRNGRRRREKENHEPKYHLPCFLTLHCQ
ncbi:uncharacterized protein K452DRAFT_283253 [Aplosporella prunicola CBS 121167]|uniref:Uncharacterized protein n=1 Tax=Aplosporella prunicola CBS 121167 TaxID=1176127 RepID=A0A6A6BPA3_9PEZI|nr:uncharacterized protein K452DRAFT_283253 [Aplosporella prunicola CBS 121167]KAF2145960.1 hypothetical protein K452DRAFT_283253 [Aplosporella prunicola CBS 121167]